MPDKPDQLRQKIVLMVAQAAPFDLIQLWSRADFKQLYEDIESLIREREDQARDGAKRECLEKVVEDWYAEKDDAPCTYEEKRDYYARLLGVECEVKKDEQ